MKSSNMYTSHITGVRFKLTGTADSNADSNVTINSVHLYRNNQPYPGGPCDSHLGTNDYSYNCATCLNNKRWCLGHEGNILLNYPVWNPYAINEAKKWLKLICFECGHPVISREMYLKFPASQRLYETHKLARSGVKVCPHCEKDSIRSIHPIIKKDKTQPLSITAEYIDDKKLINKVTIYPHIAANIFAKISDTTIRDLGREGKAHPKEFILYSIKVPPVTIRMDTKKSAGSRSSNDDLTSMLHYIITKNDSIPSELPDIINEKLAKNIFELNNGYCDFVKAGGESAINSIASRLKGKGGQIRKCLMGKRVSIVCRSTIAGDPTLPIDVVGIPISFARTVQLQDTVQDYNKKQLLAYVQNGRDRYPGASAVIKKSTGISHDTKITTIDLENGDIVLRDMVDGDPVNFGRQPSLVISNISTHKAKIITDPEILTLMMNVLITPYYNADFDGDAMNLIICPSVGSRNEIAEISGVKKWFISHTTSSPALGQVNDSVIGLYELTRRNVLIDKYHAMMMFRNCGTIPKFNDIAEGQHLSGRDCIGLSLKETPIDFVRPSYWYRPNMAQWIKYDPTEIKVHINRGNMLEGVLDKRSIGKGVNGGIYHIIATDYGAEKALEIIFNMQQMAIAHALQFGFTTGIMDLLVSKAAKIEIDQIGSDIINKSNLITQRLLKGEIIPPIDKTIDQFYEEQQIETLRILDDFNEPILKSINPNTNNLFKLIMAGSKGEINNMHNMTSSVGQKLINGNRIHQKFGYKRTLVYFPRFDTSPESRGFITNSYLGGMTPPEYLFNAMASRFDLISKALSTSITGEQNRKSIKSLESVITGNLRQCNRGDKTVQLAYGEDFLDPRYVERVRFPTVMLSDQQFSTTYDHPAFQSHFAALSSDRQKYRQIFMAVEQMNIKELMTDERKMPVNVERIIKDTLSNNGQPPKATPAQLSQMVATVDALCAGLPYVMINEIQERLQSPIPEYIEWTVWLLRMLIKSYLNPRALESLSPPLLQLIINKIRIKLTASLIDPGTAVGIIAAQAFSEPLTQYMLDAHHHSASGGTSKLTMTKSKEILSAREVDKLVSPSMQVPVIEEFRKNKAKVSEIANNLEMMKLKQFITICQIFYEKCGEPIHSSYLHEKTFIQTFIKSNPLLPPPADLTKWCVRFVLNKTTLILKNMSLDLIIIKLRERYPDTYIVYSPENAKQIIIRIYVKNSMYREQLSLNDIIQLKDEMYDMTIRGVNGIISTSVQKLIRNKIDPAGAIVRDDENWGIVTTGTNFQGIATNKFVDRLKIQTDAIQEVYKILGIEAARQKIVSELRNIIDLCNHRHYLVYADEMTFTGRVTSIESSGVKARETSNILLRMGFSAPLSTLEEAVINSAETQITGITAPFLVGSVPRIGTTFNGFHIDKDFVKKNIKKPTDIINELFQ